MPIEDDPAIRGLLMLTGLLKATGKLTSDSALAIVTEICRGESDEFRKRIWARANEVMPGFLRE